MEQKDQFRDYSNVTICNEEVVKIRELISSMGKGEVNYYEIEHEVMTRLLMKIYDLRCEKDRLLEANKNLAKERNDLKGELWNIKYGPK